MKARARSRALSLSPSHRAHTLSLSLSPLFTHAAALLHCCSPRVDGGVWRGRGCTTAFPVAECAEDDASAGPPLGGELMRGGLESRIIFFL